MTGSFINLYNDRGLLESETAYGCGYLLRGTDMVDLTALARSMNNMSDVDRALSEFYINRVYSYDSQGRIESMNTVKTDESSAVYNTKQEPTGQTFIYDYSYRTGY
ncbi:MAG: hypothetical protein IJM76_10640 [Lachnospiraceae bacterium]|nr:hypothetical protein [Lachnospiraceae bacterium]